MRKRHWHASTLVFQVIGIFTGGILYGFRLSRPLLLAQDMDNKKNFPLVLGALVLQFYFRIWLRTNVLGSPFLSLVVVAPWANTHHTLLRIRTHIRPCYITSYLPTLLVLFIMDSLAIETERVDLIKFFISVLWVYFWRLSWLLFTRCANDLV
jgi:hypothetical protein